MEIEDIRSLAFTPSSHSRAIRVAAFLLATVMTSDRAHMYTPALYVYVSMYVWMCMTMYVCI